MGENTDLVKSTKKGKKSQKRKLQQQQEEKLVGGENQVEQESLTKLRKPQTPSKKSHKKVKKEQRVEEEKEKTMDKYKASAVTYLESWKNDKTKWKFSKNIQNWIVSHLYDSTLLPQSLWPITIEYFTRSMGIVKKNILEQATKIIEDENANEEECQDTNIKLNRAKDLIQCVDD